VFAVNKDLPTNIPTAGQGAQGGYRHQYRICPNTKKQFEIGRFIAYEVKPGEEASTAAENWPAIRNLCHSWEHQLMPYPAGPNILITTDQPDATWLRRNNYFPSGCGLWMGNHARNLQQIHSSQESLPYFDNLESITGLSSRLSPMMGAFFKPGKPRLVPLRI